MSHSVICLAAYVDAYEAYIKAVTEATEDWKSTVDELGAQVMPPTTSIDIEDYSDYKN